VVGLPAVADQGAAALVSVGDDEGTDAVLVDLDGRAAQDLGTGVQGAAFSPDGAQIAWSRGERAELRIGPVEDLSSAEVVAEGLALPVWLNGG
jgi:hypothetical protein